MAIRVGVGYSKALSSLTAKSMSARSWSAMSRLKPLLAHNSHYYDVFDIGRHCIGRYHPSLLSELVLKVKEGPLGGLLIFRLHQPCEQRIGNIR